MGVITISHVPSGVVEKPVTLADGDTLDIGIDGAVIVTAEFAATAGEKADAFDVLPHALQEHAKLLLAEQREARLRAYERDD